MRYIRAVAAVSDSDEFSDGELLDRFVRQRDEAAFAAIVARHGGMVWAVCRKFLDREQDAEDAFQAVFLTLARKAASAGGRNCLPGWLHEVSRRITANLRREARRRAKVETAAAEQPRLVADDLTWREGLLVLDEELARMPQRYRAVLIVCCLEGRSRDEAARQLGWTQSQVKGRLERGRDLLRRRLSRRGLDLGAILLATTSTAFGSIPATVVLATIQAAPAFAAGQSIAAEIVSSKVTLLSEGVLQAMFLTKIKIVTALALMLGMLGMGSVLLPDRTATGQQISAEKAEEKREEAPKVTPPVPPKKLTRMPEPPADLMKEISQWDKEYRHQSEEKFVELEKKAEALLKKWPNRDDQATILFQVTHVAGQSGSDKQFERIEKYARKSLELSRDAVLRGWLLMYLTCTAQSDKAAKTFEERRRLAAEALLSNYAEVLVQDLPAKTPEVPPVQKVVRNFDGEEPAGNVQERQERALQIEAHLEAKFIGELISRRETMLTQLRDLYRPSVYQYGRNADGPEELRELAKKKLTNPKVVESLIARVTGPKDKTDEESNVVKRINGDLVLVAVERKHGLKVDDLLEVYRTEGQPIHVGSLRIVAIDHTEVMGKLTTKSDQEAKVGDLVAKKVPQ